MTGGTATDKLMQRVADLDREATKGPWRDHPLGHGAWIEGDEGQIAVVYGPNVNRLSRGNGALVRESRVLLPLLAKMVAEALPVLRQHQPMPGDGRICVCSQRWPCDEARALAEIEAFAAKHRKEGA